MLVRLLHLVVTAIRGSCQHVFHGRISDLQISPQSISQPKPQHQPGIQPQVVFGDIFYCIGQSNMMMDLSNQVSFCDSCSRNLSHFPIWVMKRCTVWYSEPLTRPLGRIYESFCQPECLLASHTHHLVLDRYHVSTASVSASVVVWTRYELAQSTTPRSMVGNKTRNPLARSTDP